MTQDREVKFQKNLKNSRELRLSQVTALTPPLVRSRLLSARESARCNRELLLLVMGDSYSQWRHFSPNFPDPQNISGNPIAIAIGNMTTKGICKEFHILSRL